MLRCPVCNSSKFTKESNYLICEYCGSNRKIDRVQKKDISYIKYLIMGVFILSIVFFFVINNQKDISKKPNSHIADKKDLNPEPKIDIVNDNSMLETQIIQTSDKLKKLSVKNKNSNIQTQVIQTKNITDIKTKKGNKEEKAILLSTKKTVYNAKGEILSSTKKVHFTPKENYIDANGIRHKTIYTKLPKIDLKNSQLHIDNSNIKIQNQNVSFHIDEKGVKHYRALTTGLKE
jgi:hypothetical protein